jgi:putative ABC transport system permease protein
MSQPIGPPWIGVACAAAPMIVCAVVLAWRRLGQVRPLAIASVRLVLQLLLLGVVLQWVIETKDPYLVVAVALLMLAASAHAVGARQKRGTWALRLEAFCAMALGAFVVMFVGTRLSLGIQPWYDPATLVPLLGMILGNSVNGVALAAERLESDLRAERDRIELRLALGATARQAAAPALRAAVSAALTPTINSMSIAGIVAVPGMMTGQILAGARVGDALRYQILIYFLIAGTVGISTLTLLGVRLRRYFTRADQLRYDLI